MVCTNNSNKQENNTLYLESKKSADLILVVGVLMYYLVVSVGPPVSSGSNLGL